MRNDKITPLYERLSRDDELQGDSNTTLAYLLAKRGHQTALIDFDGQGHSSIIFGVKNPNKVGGNNQYHYPQAD